MAVFKLDDEIAFPYPELAEEDGLLAIGGDLSVDRLLLAYCNGIFPWYNPEEDILWWCPKKRFIIRPSNIHISKSMRKYMRKHDIFLDINRDFLGTVRHCREQREFKEGTWISDDIEEAYFNLFKAGFAISVEAFVDGELAGGLYGVLLGKCFFGESMFSVKENGSKVALIMLAKMLEEDGFYMIDCQFRTDHLATMGGEYISWSEYKAMLLAGIEYQYDQDFGIVPMNEDIMDVIRGKSYPADDSDCRISPEELAYVYVLYVDFEGKTQKGGLICNKAIATDLLDIFRQLYEAEYPIEKIRLIDAYDADDERSMADNNSSAFNYRVIAGTDRLSNHAMGMAVDINPLYNPYLPNNPNTTPIQPANGAPYVDREKAFAHKIDHDDLCYKLFIAHGFTWGGDWEDSKDYQHFEKAFL